MPTEKITIENEDFLLRRYPFLDPNYIRDDGTISSFAFKLKKGEDGLSVDLESKTTLEKSILDKSKFRLCKLKAKIPRDFGLDCIHDPVENNYAHSLIVGKITPPISKKLSSSVIKLKYPD